MKKVYGPYTRRDGRQVVIIRTNGSSRTVSYPKFLIERELGRKLNDDETVHHIDGDFSNNSIENLRVLARSRHSGFHAKKMEPVRQKCIWCGSEFVLTGKKISDRKSSQARGKAGPFCSRSCSGKFGKAVQMGEISSEFLTEFRNNREPICTSTFQHLLKKS